MDLQVFELLTMLYGLQLDLYCQMFSRDYLLK